MKKQKVTWSEAVQFNCRRINPRNEKQWVLGSVVPGVGGTYMGAILESAGDNAEEVFEQHSHRIVCTDAPLLQALLSTELAVENHKFSKLSKCECKEIGKK